MDTHTVAAAPAARRDTPTGPRACRSIRRVTAVAILSWMALISGAAAAQDSGAVSEQVMTRTRRDVNGRDAIDEKVVTRTSRTSGREEVVTEIYRPSTQADRLALARRIRRVTTPTGEGLRTVEECEERPLAAPHEPLRLVERSITIVRKTGPDSYSSEIREFGLDVNGRLVPREGTTEGR